MLSSRDTTRSIGADAATAQARNRVLDKLMNDHERVKSAYREFQNLADEDPEACEEIVQRVIDELTLHSKLEEELLYPAARARLADDELIDEAEVEHETMHRLIDQLRQMTGDDDKYTARFTVLCEYVLHHLKEEESQMFPMLECTHLDWESLAAGIDERRRELTAVERAQDMNLEWLEGEPSTAHARSRGGSA